MARKPRKYPDTRPPAWLVVAAATFGAVLILTVAGLLWCAIEVVRTFLEFN